MAVIRPVLLALGCLFLAAAAAVAGDVDPLAKHFGGPFTLTSHQNASVSDADFRGKFMLVSFGYTHCPDICPTVLGDITAALNEMGPDADMIQPIFITVDPARDTPSVLAQYQKSFDPRMIMLTGSEEQIAAVAKAYRVHRRKYVFPPGDGHQPDAYGVDHGSLVYLMGPDGTFRTFFPLGTPPDKIAEILKRYVAADQPSH